MKYTIFSLLLLLTTVIACSHESSPEGRSQLRDEKIQQEIEILKQQHTALLDSIHNIRQELDKIQHP
jgi:ABC-type transporter MlaC component